jgi:GAF domain
VEADPCRIERAEAALRAVADLPQLMRTAAHVAATVVEAGGCAISRIIGDVLVELAEFAGSRQTLYLGHGYLISDYPLTRESIETREARTVFARDPDADEREVELLDELRFDALLIVPICVGGDAWGLAELYREGNRPFVDADAAAATLLFAVVGERVAELETRR